LPFVERSRDFRRKSAPALSPGPIESRNCTTKAGHDSLTVHTLRKSCGQNWANHLPIHVTQAYMGHAEIVRMLLAKGADPNVRDKVATQP